MNYTREIEEFDLAIKNNEAFTKDLENKLIRLKVEIASTNNNKMINYFLREINNTEYTIKVLNKKLNENISELSKIM